MRLGGDDGRKSRTWSPRRGMSIRTGSRPRRQLYWPKAGSWQFHVSWFRLHIAFAAGKSKRRSNNLAGSWSQRSPADDLALNRHAVYAQHAAFAPAKSAAFALRWFIVLGSP